MRSSMTDAEFEDHKWHQRAATMQAHGRQFTGIVTERRGSWFKVEGHDGWLIPSRFADRAMISPVPVGAKAIVELDKSGYVRSVWCRQEVQCDR